MCDNEFSPKQKHQRFCSLRCKTKHWKVNHIEKRNEWDSNWQNNDYKKNPRKYLEKHKKRQILKKKYGYVLTKKDWERIKKKYSYTCTACGKQEPNIKLTVDHIVPLSKNGKHIYKNIQPLCHSCNSRKGAKLSQQGI